MIYIKRMYAVCVKLPAKDQKSPKWCPPTTMLSTPVLSSAECILIHLCSAKSVMYLLFTANLRQTRTGFDKHDSNAAHDKWRDEPSSWPDKHTLWDTQSVSLNLSIASQTCGSDPLSSRFFLVPWYLLMLVIQRFQGCVTEHWTSGPHVAWFSCEALFVPWYLVGPTLP